jgi:glycosyltransferase involved in cell wall biosynthesis
MAPISVVIPAYNEAASISKVLESLKSYMRQNNIEHEIIVIDDCSSDGTAGAAARPEVAVVSHPVNRGYGAALTTGLKKAKYGHVLIMDADESYPVDDISKLMPYINDFDMVVGARQGAHYHGSPVKRMSRIIFSALLKYVTGEKVPDANSGMRIFKKDVVMQFEDDFCSGFSFTTTITIILLSNGYLTKFVPIGYMSRTGKSKVRHLRDTIRTVQILLHTIVYYNPVKAFMPFSVISALAFALSSLLYIFRRHDMLFGMAAVISFLFAMLFMAFGMITYAVVKSGRKR